MKSVKLVCSSGDHDNLSEIIERRATSTAIGLICDVRLGILLACEIGIISGWSNFFPIIVLLAATGMSWIPIYVFRISETPTRQVKFFTLCDLLISLCLVLVLSISFTGAVYLAISYAIVSSLLVGLTTSALLASFWTIGIVISFIVMRSTGHELSTVFWIVTTFAVAGGVILGNRLHNQFRQIGLLSSQVAASRARESAASERLMIARDLHDSLAKSVHGIRMLAESLNRSLNLEGHHDVPLSEALFLSADEASREARLVLDGLRVSGENNIISVLTQQAERWSERTGISLLQQTPSSLTHATCRPWCMWNLQRILGEALTNIERHARATTVTFQCKIQNETFYMKVSDDGVGSSSTEDRSSKGHYGLLGMQERAASIGGDLRCESPSHEGSGFQVHLSAPIFDSV